MEKIISKNEKKTNTNNDLGNGFIVPGQVTAIIDQGASFDGKLTFEGAVRISGDFTGEIYTHDTLIIDSSAQVEAEIEADFVLVLGKVYGHIKANKSVIMKPPAVFQGTVTTPSLRIDEGVVFEGASYMPKEV